MPSPNHLPFTNQFIHIAWPIKRKKMKTIKYMEEKKIKKLSQNYKPGC
jgi:hypothetical protein